jgi:hypothetical protein
LIGVIIISALFSFLHDRDSVESFLYTLSAGIIFSYIYFGLGSLAGAFLVHAIHNSFLSIFSAFGHEACSSISDLFQDFAFPIFAIGLIVVACLAASMARMTWRSTSEATCIQ